MTATLERPAERDVLYYHSARERKDDAQMRRSMAEHVATYRVLGEGDDRIEHLTWAKPGTGIYRVDYLTRGPWLYISGDMGSAVYCRAPSLAWWATLYPNFCYFTEKCTASEVGRHAREFSDEAVREAVRAYLVDLARDARSSGSARYRERLKRARKIWREEDGEAATYDRNDWIQWRRDHGYLVFGEDHWERDSLDGQVITYAARFHLLGVHLAMQQLYDRGVLPAPTPRNSDSSGG